MQTIYVRMRALKKRLKPLTSRSLASRAQNLSTKSSVSEKRVEVDRVLQQEIDHAVEEAIDEDSYVSSERSKDDRSVTGTVRIGGYDSDDSDDMLTEEYVTSKSKLSSLKLYISSHFGAQSWNRNQERKVEEFTFP